MAVGHGSMCDVFSSFTKISFGGPSRPHTLLRLGRALHLVIGEFKLRLHSHFISGNCCSSGFAKGRPVA